ncbi:TfoX/Sxy family protein [Paucibacter sp. B2R-40]|jgi:DNA transformation protein|uniref:TfoX/Sxy family protein n=1 Tax=Paucibacter sp. B2R-40 TaxID=2893554 RepID=UPI0021E4B261|nr:TfoX/Sxy family protein [Paucibacter sp. B2R-40]MCV2353750.1 TfoX/Sxy family protein [Paucibacter sp. B2R-40]
MDAAQPLRGLGPKSRAQLSALGVHSLSELRAHDAVALYARLKQQWPGASINLLYALIGAQDELDWRVVARQRRTELLLRLDDLGLAPK